MPLVYSIAITLLFLVLFPVLLVHPKVRSGLRLRLGLYPPDFLADASGPRIWLHGASAGDLLALLPIYRELRRRRPDATFIVSTMTNSGEAIARTRFADAAAITFIPWDLPWSTRAAVRALKPDLLVLEYTEIWPNLIRAVRRSGGRVAVTNGRFSERNVGRYKLLFALTGNVLRDIDLLLMREDAERERALALGAPASSVRVTGNTKFDALLLSSTTGDSGELGRALGLRDTDIVFVAGSTHEGEEGALLDVFASLRAEHPRLRLLIAPRYVERAPRIAAMAEGRGLSVGFRSEAQGEAPYGDSDSNPESDHRDGGGDGDGNDLDDAPPVLLLDTIGELVAAYRLATLVFVGGSFTRRGGQNILEPAACGKAVLFGPHMENFRDSVQALLGRGGIQVNDPQHLGRVARELLARPEKLSELGRLARQAISGIRGASERNAQQLASLVERPRRRSRRTHSPTEAA